MAKKNKDKYKFVDLFVGAGGLSEGLTMAGLFPLYASDVDEQAMMTFKYNHPDVFSEVADIKKITAKHISEATKTSLSDIDLVAGGPPCQGFSLAGRRLPDSPKNKLVLEFLRLVSEIQPKVFLFENVPGITSMQNGAVVEALNYEFKKLGYNVDHKILNPVNFGVPQSRPRFIMMGTKIGAPVFPRETHYGNGNGELKLFEDNLREPISVKDAFSGLPELEQGEGEEEMLAQTKPNGYHKEKYGKRKPGVIFNHRATRHSDRIIHRYSLIPSGGTNKDLPIEIRTKKNNVYRLHPKKHSRTVTCNFRTDLLHPWKPRGITVREAARLQSFDDDYRFFGNLTRKAKWLTQDDQVGNSVPPVFAKSLGFAIIDTINKNYE